ncbi:MAG: sterol desaturase family protein [Synechococcaceae cyanobacterium]|nr:sterol desaturase family protein [Synechococcaceae cyanobacterium]
MLPPQGFLSMTLTVEAIAVDAVRLFLMILARYFLIAGGVFWLLETRGRSPANGTRPAAAALARARILGDIHHSVQAAVVFALAAAALVAAARMGLTRLYDEPARHGWWYLGASYALVLLLQDAYFYFTHRLFHHPRLYRWFHAGHHQSREPTAWTSFAFDTPEAAVQALFLLAIVFVLPLHWITLFAVLVTMSVWAVINHLGLDRLPVSFPHGWLGRWFIGPAHHSLHHRRQGVHFGLYFTFWDRLLGTEDPAYLQAATPD